MSIFGPAYVHGSVPTQFAVHGGLIPVHGSTTATLSAGGGGSYTPALKFNDARNSQYIVLLAL